MRRVLRCLTAECANAPAYPDVQVRKPWHPADQQIRQVMDGVAAITTSDARRADAALVRRFRQAQTEQERTAVFADVVRQHRDAVLCCCAELLWPDADAAVAAAGDVLIAARLAMADPAKLARPDRLGGWLLGIAGDGLTSARPAGIDDINWEAMRARVAAEVPAPRESPARRESLRHWLDQIVATLPEPRQRLFDLFVASGLDSQQAALELGTNIAEVRRLRRENRQAILRAVEVTSLAAAEASLDAPGSAPGCRDLRQILADAQPDGDPHEGIRRRIVVLPAALRLTVARHLSQCGTCQGRRGDCTTPWGPELLPILAGTELNEQVMEDLHAMSHLARPGGTAGAHRRVASGGTAKTVVVRRPAAAAGAGLLAALLLLAFVWPGFLHKTAATVLRSSTAPSSQDPRSSGVGAPQVTGTSQGVPGHNDGRLVRPGTGSPLNSLPADPTGGLGVLASSSATPTIPPPVLYTTQPPTPSPTPSAQPTSDPSPTRSTPAPSTSPSASQPTEVPSTSPPITTPPSPPPTSTPPSSTPSPSTSPSSTPSPTITSASTTPSPSTPSTPASSMAPQPTPTPSTSTLS
jgi:DNA-directed RNA polymerase specialized sigma24 family protein